MLSDLTQVRAPEHFERGLVLRDGGHSGSEPVPSGRRRHRGGRSSQFAPVARFNAQAFANLVWAYATVKHDHPQMFDVIEHAAIQCFDQFDPQNLANFAWAYATVESLAPVVRCFAQALLPRLDDFIAEGLSSTAWAYAKAGIPAPALFREVLA